MCEAPSTWRASTCAIVPRSFIAAYSGLIAAPGTPKACEMPSFSITNTPAITAFIRAIAVSFSLRFIRADVRGSALRWEAKGGDKSYSGVECLGHSPASAVRRRQRATAPAPESGCRPAADSPALLQTRGTLDNAAPGTDPQIRRGRRAVPLQPLGVRRLLGAAKRAPPLP